MMKLTHFVQNSFRIINVSTDLVEIGTQHVNLDFIRTSIPGGRTLYNFFSICEWDPNFPTPLNFFTLRLANHVPLIYQPYQNFVLNDGGAGSWLTWGNLRTPDTDREVSALFLKSGIDINSVATLPRTLEVTFLTAEYARHWRFIEKPKLDTQDSTSLSDAVVKSFERTAKNWEFKFLDAIARRNRTDDYNFRENDKKRKVEDDMNSAISRLNAASARAEALADKSYSPPTRPPPQNTPMFSPIVRRESIPSPELEAIQQLLNNYRNSSQL